MSDVIERITTYLITGGLFNPELADHFAVRNLLIDASVELSAERERRSHYQRIAAELTDKLNGTPCAEIRWQQERDALLALLREAREYTGYAAHYGDSIEADRIDDALNKGGGDE